MLRISKNPETRMISGFFCEKNRTFAKVLPLTVDT
jgi:hypothetical protein